MMKKIFFVFVIFLFFTSFANAIVVQDISEQIEQGNTKIIENNAKIESNVSQLKTQIAELQVTINQMKADALNKDDMGLIRYNIDQAMYLWQQQMLILFLVVIIFAYLIGLYGKAKGWF